ncbi:MAG: hypothetical protein VB101_01075 [Rhodospirillaceae bacterium]|nr:hypothetical protein [Rhodospirillaceae bacterium]
MTAWTLPVLALLPLILALVARLHGGGLWPDFPKLPLKILFGAPFGAAAYLLTGSPVVGLIGWAVTATAYAVGHGTVYGMRGYDSPRDPNRIERLELIIRPIWQAVGWDISRPAYSWAVMGVKGLLIGLPTGPGALALAVLWPASYWIGRRVEADRNEVAEWVSGCAAGCVALAVIWMQIDF